MLEPVTEKAFPQYLQVHSLGSTRLSATIFGWVSGSARNFAMYSRLCALVALRVATDAHALQYFCRPPVTMYGFPQFWHMSTVPRGRSGPFR